MLLDAEFFVAIGFLLFVAALIYLGVHRQIVGALDARIAGVEKELAEAKRLREEANALRVSFEAKRKEAEAEAARIVAQARLEAEALSQEAQTRLNEYVARRTRQAQDRIALAEAQASNDVRAAAAEAAVKAVEQVLQDGSQPAVAGKLINEGIRQIKRLAH